MENEAAKEPAKYIRDWVVEACVSPGVRKLVWLGRADGPGEAMRKAKAVGENWTAFYVKPNLIATLRDVRETKDGAIWPQMWDDEFDWQNAP